MISSPPIVSAPRGSIKPHSLLLRIPKTDETQPERRERDAHDVELGPVLDFGADLHPPRTSRITATMTVSPANT